MSDDPSTAKLVALVQRYCQLGRLLPNDLDVDDAATMAEAKLVVAEMAATKAAMDALLGRHLPLTGLHR